MKEPTSNLIEIDIINENCVRIKAKCNPKSIEERNQQSKESLFSNNSLVLSNTLSSVNTIRFSKNSLAGSLTNGVVDIQNRETPKKVEKQSLELKGESKFSLNERNNEIIKAKKKFPNLKIEISKINNYFDKTYKRDEEDEDEENVDDQNNSNLCSQSVIYLSKNDDMNKLEISNKSIFFTPSICNYYQKSYIENSPNNPDSSRLRCKNVCEINDDIIPKAINMDIMSNKMTPNQIRYNKDQLQSCEKNEKAFQNNSNKMQKSKENLMPFTEKCKNKINFEETNNFTLNNIIIDIEDKNENMEPKEFKKEFHTFHDLVNEIKKELVLNISSIEEESNNNFINVDEEEKCKTGNSNYFIKNLGLNFCDMKLNNDNARASIAENEICQSELGFIIEDNKKYKTDPILASRIRKNCLSCISEISINIKPCRGKKIEDHNSNHKNLSSSNLTIQKPQNIQFSIDEKKIPINSKVATNLPKKYTSNANKSKKLQKTKSRPENYTLESQIKLINNCVNSSRQISSNKAELKTPISTENKMYDEYKKRKNSNQKNLSTLDEIGTTKNKVLKSIIMNLIDNPPDNKNQPKENFPQPKNYEKFINKTIISTTEIQPPTSIQNSNQIINTTNSLVESERTTIRPNTKNSGVLNNKHKEYLELIKLLSINSDSSIRNKPKIQDQRTNSKGKTLEVLINLDQNEKRISNQSGRISSVNNTSQNNSKSNSLTKKDSQSTVSTVKKTNSNRSIATLEIAKLQSMKLDNRNTKKNLIVPINNCPQTSKNQNIKKNLVSDLMNQQRKNSQTKKANVFININAQTPTMNDKKLQSDLTSDKSKQSRMEKDNSSAKKKLTPTNINLERQFESYNNQAENRSHFKNDVSLNIVKNKSDFVKIINNFSNYTKKKKDLTSIGMENANIIIDNKNDYKKPITSLKIRNSGGDEDSVMIDEN